ncbi:DUF4253 domain-containing protein [Brevibacillus reuszeri]|uniref:DUF4253 domain-containing protein n=1 Tax=Brevibacillus reuszeri TaxID=54915 RepID=UPI0028A126E5|nr:DUF4253 domain-containing protein [Brevibacillus reuszeri]
MVEELSQHFKECDIEVVSVQDVSLPAHEEGKHSICILPSGNLEEMLEDAIKEAGTLSDYVHQQLEEARSMTVEDAWRHIIASQLMYTDLPSEQIDLEGKSFEDLYKAYALIWEGEELLDEQRSEAEKAPLQFDAKWVQEYADEDDSLIVLKLPQEAGNEAPLWVPMGGFNDCPLPLYQSVIMKHFQEKYAITILAVTDDTWIVQAGSRPQTYEDALKLAKEHFIFCHYVLDDCPTLGYYADYLMKHDTWYFWWD